MAVVGLVVAAIGTLAAIAAIVYAHVAYRTAKNSEARATERHDVYWDGDWEDHGLYVLTKRGNDHAHAVKATVVIDDEEKTLTADHIEDEGHRLEFEFPRARAIAREAEREANRPRTGFESMYMPDWHNLTVRVEWTTDLGTPRLHAPETKGGFGY